jgi:hypothetical protein
MDDNALEEGTIFIETLWYSLACTIVERAIELYNLSEDNAKNLREKFLKRGEYTLRLE